MLRQDPKYDAFVRVMRSQLRPAMGCTEPIAVAYAAASARSALGVFPESVTVSVSGNILKNAKAVTVPNTGGKRGIEAACAVGIVAGKPERELQVIAEVSPEQQEAVERLVQSGMIRVSCRPDARLLDILVQMRGQGHTASARIVDWHTNIVELCRDDRVLLRREIPEESREFPDEELLLTIQDIYDFADTCLLDDVRELLDRQIECNTAIAREGMTGKWGACIGRILVDTYGSGDVRVRARAYAAAGSDARMSGCEMPVVINSGSGNQGITVSVPVIEYAREMHSSGEKLYRALILSNLTAIHIKTRIGYLSAYCGAVSAGSACSAGIAYLCGGGIYEINHAIVNTLAILSGTICDGAKSSCAAKIAASVDAAIVGYEMTRAGTQFRDGEGIVRKGVENTIANIGRLGREGMRGTEEEILRIMLG